MEGGKGYSATPLETVPIEELWQTFVEGGRKEGYIKRFILEYYLHLCSEMAGRVVEKYPLVTFEEMLSATYDGLERCVKLFDPSQGIKFETFANPHMHGAILDYLRSVDEVKRSHRHSSKIYERWRWEAECHKGMTRDPRPIDTIVEEIAKDQGFDMDTIKRIRIDARKVPSAERTLRILAERDDDSEMSYDPGDAEIYSPNEPLSVDDEDYFLRVLSAYPGNRQRALAFFYLFEDQSMKQVGALTDLSESRISQILTDIAWFFLDYLHKDLGGLPPSVFRKANAKYGDLDGLYEYIHKNKIDVANGIKSLLMKVSYTKEDDEETKAPPEISPQRADQLKTLLGRLKSVLNQS